MKTENTCVNCAVLECCVRLDCEDNELQIETQASEAESEEAGVTVEVVTPELAEKVVADKKSW